MTIQIRRLDEGDLDEAELLLTESYGRPDEWRAELERYLTLQPDGWFAAVTDGGIVGVGGSLDYGPFATIGLMATHPVAQRRGIATAVLDHIVHWLRGRGCPVAVLDASAAGAPVYQRYGFIDSDTTALFRQDAPAEIASVPECVARVQASQIKELAHFDAPLFGANRESVLATMLAAYPDRALVIRDSTGTITGYLFAQAHQLGPWMATTEDDAAALLVAALTLPFDGPPTVLVPGSNLSAARLLESRGFVIQRALRHMYLGPSTPLQDRTRLYGQTSFAIG